MGGSRSWRQSGGILFGRPGQPREGMLTVRRMTWARGTRQNESGGERTSSHTAARYCDRSEAGKHRQGDSGVVEIELADVRIALDVLDAGASADGAGIRVDGIESDDGNVVFASSDTDCRIAVVLARGVLGQAFEPDAAGYLEQGPQHQRGRCDVVGGEQVLGLDLVDQRRAHLEGAGGRPVQ